MSQKLERRLMMNLARTHDRTVSEREQGAEQALRAGNGMATVYWQEIARTALRTIRAKSRSEQEGGHD